MKKILHSINTFALATGLLCASVSCTDDFNDLNTNPNSASSGTADLFLPHGIQSAVDTYWGGTLGQDIGNLYAQHWARIQYTDIDQYTVSADVYNLAWQNFFIEALADYQRVYTISTETGNPNYQAVSLIMKAWVFSLLTDIYGDIPYDQALQGLDDTLLPTYTSQKDVYAGLIGDLKTANDLITLTGNSISGDILLNGNMLKWKKFANSLSLRILNRMLDKSDASLDVKTEIGRILSNPTQYPIIASNADNIQLNYLDATNNNNPVNQNRKTRDDHRVSATLVNRLLELDDDRLTVYANLPADGGPYKGVPNGLAASDANALGLSKTSTVGSYFVAATAPGVIITYAEVLFLKSEMAYKGITSAGDMEENYKAGITASFAQYKLTVAPAYLEANALKSGEQGYYQLIEQKWISLFGQGIEAWTEFRRTGIPTLSPPLLNTNGNVIPTRLPYPTSEESLNYENFSSALSNQGGQNDMKLKLWFAK
ncbi:SusD-like starch-binding protein associating with outer membrane [Dyadobacter jejuensis]|uniref:SusD-like starch-binding protein associating with outer membrane n=1 Tax=Dyadobacter jejuensis TaxID=1082580 RepID=A0A316API3_9BACT|nr:SusD/RagB family nutrient-binding outer membrane lipoprotein [Dyadobacter jejuensis]PWJ59492.1 SusD-like starch-binding protein associating with outer membrane [Dyadobacter jejuensis]